MVIALSLLATFALLFVTAMLLWHAAETGDWKVWAAVLATLFILWSTWVHFADTIAWPQPDVDQFVTDFFEPARETREFSTPRNARDQITGNGLRMR